MSPPMDAAHSTAPANSPGMPYFFISGMVKAPTTVALAAPLPLIMPTADEASTAVCGIVTRDLPAIRRMNWTIAPWASKPAAAAARSRKAPIVVSAICAYCP